MFGDPDNPPENACPSESLPAHPDQIADIESEVVPGPNGCEVCFLVKTAGLAVPWHLYIQPNFDSVTDAQSISLLTNNQYYDVRANLGFAFPNEDGTGVYVPMPNLTPSKSADIYFGFENSVLGPSAVFQYQ